MKPISKTSTPRIKIIQNLYSKLYNSSIEFSYSKNQFKKFIKDVTEGTIERGELIEETILKYLKDDFDFKKSDKILNLVLKCAVFELLFKPDISKKIIISEYLKTAEFFLDKSKIRYLNAIMDKISKIIRKN
tara:strand:- start:14 stop:409 length:396 start_codon:yes stop_codon:yes gene_type:complete